jgi:hypothetical protein
VERNVQDTWVRVESVLQSIEMTRK